jgi:stage IV sporulation protein FB
LKPYVFSLLGFPVIIQPGFYILAGVYSLFGLQAQEPLISIASFVVVVFLSIILHELGHALSCRRFGLEVLHIQLHGFGGEVLRRAGTNWQNLIVSLAGPGAGLLFGTVVFLLVPFVPESGPAALGVLIGQLLWVNIGWSLLNLLPIAPLDGGVALGSFLAIVSPKLAWPITWVVGSAIGVGVAVLGFANGMPILGAIGGYLGYNNIRALRQWKR